MNRSLFIFIGMMIALLVCARAGQTSGLSVPSSSSDSLPRMQVDTLPPGMVDTLHRPLYKEKPIVRPINHPKK